ncbi:MAG: hypothetical protein AABY22_03765 [Nanoarchaeota archaeon]
MQTEIKQVQDGRRTFVNTVLELAKTDDKILFIVPDVGFNYLSEETLPGRYFNLGITEYCSSIIAATMALSGFKPILYSMIPFVVFRIHEMVRNAICLHKANVKIAGVLGGPSYKMLGLSHNLLYPMEDVDMMKTLPNMEIYLPSNNSEVVEAVKQAFSHEKPSYLRLP